MKCVFAENAHLDETFFRRLADNIGMTVRRMKTYTGGQGYVYQYYFVGKRAAIEQSSAASEYVFDVTSDRKTTFSVSVLLAEEVVRSWGASHGRALTAAEQYAAVKMRLFQAFDDVENMRNDGRSLAIDEPALDALLATLGVL